MVIGVEELANLLRRCSFKM